MEEQTVNQLDNLLLQLGDESASFHFFYFIFRRLTWYVLYTVISTTGIETRELAQRKDDLKQQIQRTFLSTPPQWKHDKKSSPIYKEQKNMSSIILSVVFLVCESNIQEKKDYIQTTHITISKLDEEIQQKQNTVKFIKENTKKYGNVWYFLFN